jgi:hypothetical protein
MLTIHKFSRHGELAPENCAPMCHNILFLAANPTYCHPCWRSTNLVATATWRPRNVHPCATTSYFSQQTPPIYIYNITSVYPSASGLFRTLCTQSNINRRNGVRNRNALIFKRDGQTQRASWVSQLTASLRTAGSTKYVATLPPHSRVRRHVTCHQ